MGGGIYLNLKLPYISTFIYVLQVDFWRHLISLHIWLKTEIKMECIYKSQELHVKLDLVFS